MAATLHWALRAHLKDLREDGRLAVLTALILHANIRNRCWVSTDILAVETGWSRPSIVHAKQWLAAHGVFVLVPFHKRVDEELYLPPRQHVYQLTGIMTFDGEAVPYLLMNPEAQTAIELVVKKLSESKATESKATESKVGKLSPTLPKDSSLLEDDSLLEGNTTTTSSPGVVVEAPRPTIFSLYEQNFGGLGGQLLTDSLKDIAAEFPEGWIEEAFKIAVDANKRDLRYLRGILRRWKTDGRGAPAASKPETPNPPTKPAAPAPPDPLKARTEALYKTLPELPPDDYLPDDAQRDFAWRTTGRRAVARQLAEKEGTS